MTIAVSALLLLILASLTMRRMRGLKKATAWPPVGKNGLITFSGLSRPVKGALAGRATMARTGRGHNSVVTLGLRSQPLLPGWATWPTPTILSLWDLEPDGGQGSSPTPETAQDGPSVGGLSGWPTTRDEG